VGEAARERLVEVSGARLDDYEDDARRVGWRTRAEQALRFEALLEAVPPGALGPELRLLDAGCGLGHLLEHLERTGRRVDYTGVDVSPRLIEAARRRHPEARFEVADLRELEGEWDLVVSAGGLALHDGPPEEAWGLVERLYGLCRQALALDLDLVAGLPEEDLLRRERFAVDAAELPERLRRIAPRFAIREDAVPDQAVVYLYKGLLRPQPALAGVLSPVDLAELRLDHEEPEAALELLGAGEPETAQAAYVRGAALAVLGGERLDEGVRWLERAVELDPARPRYATSLVTVLQGRGDVARAVQVARGALEAVASDPEGAARLRRQLHRLYLRAGATDAAEALEVDADPVEARLLEAMRHLAGGDAAAAEAAIAAALPAEGPADLRLLVLRSQLAMQAKRWADVLRDAADLLDVRPSRPDFQRLAIAAVQQLEAEGDRDALKAALEPLREHRVLSGLAAKHLG